MKHKTLVLAAILVLQLGLVGFMGFGLDRISGPPTGKPLLHVNATNLAALTIDEQGKSPLKLVRSDGKWVLPALQNFPADQEKIEHLVDTLVGLHPRLPVATSALADARFRVNDENYERRVSFIDKHGKTVQRLYLGSSAGPRRSHARVGGDYAVYEVEVGTWQVSAKPQDWTDSAYLHVDSKSLVEVQLPGADLKRDKNNWELADSDKSLDQDKVRELVGRLARMNFTAVLGEKAKSEYNQDQPVLEATLVPKSGDPIALRFSKLKGHDDYVLKASNHDYYFEVAPYEVTALTKLSPDTLLKPSAPATQQHAAKPVTGPVSGKS